MSENTKYWVLFKGLRKGKRYDALRELVRCKNKNTCSKCTRCFKSYAQFKFDNTMRAYPLYVMPSYNLYDHIQENEYDNYIELDNDLKIWDIENYHLVCAECVDNKLADVEIKQKDLL